MKRLITPFCVFFSIFLTAQIPSYVPTNGLVGWYTFTGNVNDSSGNANNGINYGATLTEDRFGNPNCAYFFNGINAFIQVNQISITGSSPRTISYWYEQDSLLPTVEVSWGPNIEGERFDCAVNYQDSGVSPGLSNAAITYKYLPNSNLKSWNFFCFVVPNMQNPTLADVLVYQNGVNITNSVINQNPSTGINTSSGYPLFFGKTSTVGGEAYAYGKLDDIGLWNRALTQNEITSLYNASSTEILNPRTNSDITIYPNPSHDRLEINVENFMTKTGVSMKITNGLGQIVYNKPLNQQLINVTVSDWTGKGVYLLSILDEKNQVVISKEIIVQ